MPPHEPERFVEYTELKNAEDQAIGFALKDREYFYDASGGYFACNFEMARREGLLLRQRWLAGRLVRAPPGGRVPRALLRSRRNVRADRHRERQVIFFGGGRGVGIG